MVWRVHCASFSNFPMVPPIPLPISAALLANSDLLGLESPSALPPAAFCESVRSDFLWAPIFEEACRFCACARTDLNSIVRSWILETMFSDRRDCEVLGKFQMYSTGGALRARAWESLDVGNVIRTSGVCRVVLWLYIGFVTQENGEGV